MRWPLQTVIETHSYLIDARRIFTDDERKSVVDLIAASPKCGALIPGGGGLRKLRVPVEGRGKRGGARIIYYVHSPDIPVFLLACFAKNEKDDLSRAELNALAAALKRQVQSYTGSSG